MKSVMFAALLAFGTGASATVLTFDNLPGDSALRAAASRAESS